MTGKEQTIGGSLGLFSSISIYSVVVLVIVAVVITVVIVTFVVVVITVVINIYFVAFLMLIGIKDWERAVDGCYMLVVVFSSFFLIDHDPRKIVILHRKCKNKDSKNIAPL